MGTFNKLSLVIFVTNIVLLVLALLYFIPLTIVFALALIGIGIGLVSKFKVDEQRFIGAGLNGLFLLLLIAWVYIPPYLFSN